MPSDAGGDGQQVGAMDGLRRWFDELMNDPAFALLAFVITLLVRLRVWEWMPKRRRNPPHQHKHKVGG